MDLIKLQKSMRNKLKMILFYPRLKRKYDFDGKQLLASNGQFKDFHKGKRCFVIGNGPSLENHDLSLLRDEIVFTVNTISEYRQFPSLKTNYHFWADPNFFKEEFEDDYFIENMKGVHTQDNDPTCFFPLVGGKRFVEKHRLDQFLNIHYFEPQLEMFDGFKTVTDFTKAVPHFNTVVDYGIMLAIYMGCKEIYLLGCDCTSIVTIVDLLSKNPLTTYAYDVTEEDYNTQTNILAKTPVEDCFAGCTNILYQYRYLYHYCQRLGIQLVNCTAGGILDSVPRKPYEEVIGNT